MDIITSENFPSVSHKLSLFDCQKMYFNQSSPNELNFQEVPNVFVKIQNNIVFVIYIEYYLKM